MERRIHCNSIKSEIKWNEKLDFVCNCATHLVVTNITIKQDLLLVSDSLHGPNMYFTERELDIKEMQKTILN